ncbi:hypothetical protein F2Q68_00042478 [Brassica cretica]|uniref:Uncharacterized protein n=1 Tax=Brassica cretica TaxID=69181 RepID=A0A8S9MND6_BRACR|nr:hypothetical protein F2Q68_00042478 [Brassica cretica]
MDKWIWANEHGLAKFTALHVTNAPATANRDTNDRGLTHAGPAAATSAHHSVLWVPRST